MVRPGNRNREIIAPVIGATELRPDLDKFEVPIVLSKGHFPNPHHALLDAGIAWLALGMNQYELAQNAQFEGRKRLEGFDLQKLANQAEEVYEQYQARLPEMEINIIRNQEPGEQ